MAWHEEQALETEGFDTQQMAFILQVWLPITYATSTVHPPAQQKLFVDLTSAQRTKLGAPSEAIQAAAYSLTASDRDNLRDVLDTDASFGLGFFRAVLSPAMRFVLPTAWVATAVALAVKTLVGYLLNVEKTRETAAFLSANLAVGGKLRELWHTVTLVAGQTYFYRVIQYEVNIGSEVRQFILTSTRYALKP